jgi:serine/threonine protein kinase
MAVVDSNTYVNLTINKYSMQRELNDLNVVRKNNPLQAAKRFAVLLRSKSISLNYINNRADKRAHSPTVPTGHINQYPFTVLKDPKTGNQYILLNTDSNFKARTELGHGSEARVRTVYDVTNDKVMAVKKVSKSSLFPNPYKSLVKEAGNYKKLGIDSCIIESKNKDGKPSPYLITELMSGDMNDFVLTSKSNPSTFSEQDSLDIFYQLFQQVEHTHDLGFIHKDIKTANLLYKVTAEKIKIALTDFSSMLKIGDKDNEILGSSFFNAPEAKAQIYSPGKFSKESDMWSLGITLLALCCPAPLMLRKNNDDIEKNIKDIFEFQKSKSKNTLFFNLSKENQSRVIELIECCLKQSPGDRLTSKKGTETLLNMLSDCNSKTQKLESRTMLQNIRTVPVFKAPKSLIGFRYRVSETQIRDINRQSPEVAVKMIDDLAKAISKKQTLKLKYTLPILQCLKEDHFIAYIQSKCDVRVDDQLLRNAYKALLKLNLTSTDWTLDTKKDPILALFKDHLDTPFVRFPKEKLANLITKEKEPEPEVIIPKLISTEESFLNTLKSYIDYGRQYIKNLLNTYMPIF